MVLFLEKAQVDAQHQGDEHKERGEEDYFVEVGHFFFVTGDA
jgi:hypothetical protein